MLSARLDNQLGEEFGASKRPRRSESNGRAAAPANLAEPAAPLAMSHLFLSIWLQMGYPISAQTMTPNIFRSFCWILSLLGYFWLLAAPALAQNIAATVAPNVGASDNFVGPMAWGEAGPETSRHLALSLDTYDNHEGISAAAGIRLMLNGAVLAYNATFPYTDGASIPVEVRYDAATGVTVKFNGTTLFSNVPAPGFSFQAGDRFGFGARTGGLNERVTVDDLAISVR